MTVEKMYTYDLDNDFEAECFRLYSMCRFKVLLWIKYNQILYLIEDIKSIIFSIINKHESKTILFNLFVNLMAKIYYILFFSKFKYNLYQN